jgi:hypothetical protein
MNGGDGAKQPGEVVHKVAAEMPHLVGGTAPQIAVQQLRPQPKRHRRAKRVAPGPQPGRPAACPGQELLRQARLAYTGFALEEHTAESAVPRPPELGVQLRQLRIPPHEWNPESVIPAHDRTVRPNC